MGNYFSKTTEGPAAAARDAVQASDLSAVEKATHEEDLPADVAQIVAAGLHHDIESRPGMDETLTDLRAKYGFGVAGARTAPPEGTASLEQEARLRALLKGKRKAAPA
jgi:hypothetical protein